MRVISQYVATNLNAGPKAKLDVEHILKEEYNANIYTLKMNGNEGKKKTSRIMYLIKKILFSLKHLKKDEITVVQFPYTNNVKLMNKANKKIAIIHDLEGLRNHDKMLEKKEISFLKTCVSVICHNVSMYNYLIKNGINKEKIVILEIFDYLCDIDEHKNEHNIKKPIVVYTGNLAKACFLNQINDKKMKFVLNVYGVGKDKFDNKKIIYKGKFKPDEIPSKIEGDLGLVWDGNYDDSLDKDGLKEYTMYNCPHKLSCYLAANIPVIVWDKSAMAEFVKKENIGYLISNVYDINNLKFDDYDNKLKNVKRIGKRLRTGFYTKKAIDKAIDITK